MASRKSSCALLRQAGRAPDLILLDVNMEDASLIALVENLQRRDLDFWEEALALDRLISVYHLSQEEAARRLGHRAIHALSLPAACAPDTAGEAVARTVLTILREREEHT